MFSRRSLCAQATFALTMMINASLCFGQTTNRRFVNDDAPPSGDGLSWATAYRDLQDAIDDFDPVSPPAQIWVAQGTYAPTDRWCTQVSDCGPLASACTNNKCVWNNKRDHTFQLKEDVEIYGGFQGNEPTSFDVDDPGLGHSAGLK